MRHLASLIVSSRVALVVGATVVLLSVVGGGLYLADVGGVRSGLPAVVLRFDGQPVSRELFLRHVRLAQEAYFPQEEGATPLPRDELYQRVIADLVANYVLIDAAQKAGVTVEEGEVTQKLNDLKTTDPKRYAALSSAAGSEEALRDFIRRDLMIRKYLEAQFRENPVVVTDEEVAAIYAAAQKEMPDTQLPELDTVRELIRKELQQQKTTLRVAQIVRELQQQHEVEVLWQPND